MVSATPLTRSSYHAGDDFARLRAARLAKFAVVIAARTLLSGARMAAGGNICRNTASGAGVHLPRDGRNTGA